MSKRKICGKFVFISTHIGLIILVLIVVVQCLIAFSNWPTYTKIGVVSQRTAGFPSLTICPGPMAYKKDVLKVI